jgi:small-conductance mechanosensitive channel
MQDLIKQIVDMDRKAREITEAAQLEKVNSEKEIAAKREQIRNDYLERARKRIALNEPVERAAAEKEWGNKEKKNAQLSSKLDELYSTKGDEWINAIVARVTGE